MTGPGNRESPKIFRDTIVWQDHRNSTRDIYGCTLLTIDMVTLSKNMKEEAIDSYKKAAYLYEEMGDLSRSQEIRERIRDLSEALPPESLPPGTPRYIVLFFALVVVGILVAYLNKRRKS